LTPVALTLTVPNAPISDPRNNFATINILAPVCRPSSSLHSSFHSILHRILGDSVVRSCIPFLLVLGIFLLLRTSAFSTMFPGFVFKSTVALLYCGLASAQTYTSCNPLQSSKSLSRAIRRTLLTPYSFMSCRYSPWKGH
jgi:hypothetical protein